MMNWLKRLMLFRLLILVIQLKKLKKKKSKNQLKIDEIEKQTKKTTNLIMIMINILPLKHLTTGQKELLQN